MIDLEAIKARHDTSIVLCEQGLGKTNKKKILAALMALADTAADIPDLIADRDRLQKLLAMAACPNCDGSGGIPHQVRDGVWEQEQCRWCCERNEAVK